MPPQFFPYFIKKVDIVNCLFKIRGVILYSEKSWGIRMNIIALFERHWFVLVIVPALLGLALSYLTQRLIINGFTALLILIVFALLETAFINQKFKR